MFSIGLPQSFRQCPDIGFTGTACRRGVACIVFEKTADTGNKGQAVGLRQYLCGSQFCTEIINSGQFFLQVCHAFFNGIRKVIAGLHIAADGRPVGAVFVIDQFINPVKPIGGTQGGTEKTQLQ